MQLSPSLERLRLTACLHSDRMRRLTAGSIGVRQLEPAFVFGPRRQIQDAAWESIGDGVSEVFAAAVHIFSADANQRESLAPGGLTDGSALHRNRGIPIFISPDERSQTTLRA